MTDKNNLNVYNKIQLLLTESNNSSLKKIERILNETVGDVSKIKRKKPKTKTELAKLIDKTIKEQGNDCDLNFIDVSKITDMSKLFGASIRKNFNGDISKWDVSRVTNMSYMFLQNSKFNGDISNWDVSSVKNMHGMFEGSSFNGDISKWDVSKVLDMGNMFADSKFNGDISKWDVSEVLDMGNMFDNAVFNGDISKWRAINVKNMAWMFAGSKYSKDLVKAKVAYADKGIFDGCPLEGKYGSNGEKLVHLRDK